MTLNRSPIWLARGQALERGFDLIARVPGWRGRALRRGLDSEPAQPFALSGDARDCCARRRSPRRATASKSTWAVRSCSPGRSSSGAKACPRTACSVSPGALLRMAVIDDEGDAAVSARCARSRATASSRAGESSTISPSRSKASPPPAIDDPPFDRRRRTAAPVARRGTRSRRAAAASREVFDRLVPVRVRKRLRAAVAQHGAGLDEMHFAGKPGRAKHAQRVARERAPPRPELGVDGIGGRSSPLSSNRQGPRRRFRRTSG